MNTVCKKTLPAMDGPSFIFHPSFEEGDAEASYGDLPVDDHDLQGFMPDELTRGLARRMHYAAWRANRSLNRHESLTWRKSYYEDRNRIVVGNRKLIYRAVQKWAAADNLADDLAGECQIVLIKAVAAFNPWLGIRFSTYAFSCFMRALSRLSQRHACDRLSRSLSLESLPYGEPSSREPEEPTDPRLARLGEFFREDAPLLTSREKVVISRRYQLNDMEQETETLEEVGRYLKLSKERVRQLQNAALLKLREALNSAAPLS